jgi:hypothetical protein
MRILTIIFLSLIGLISGYGIGSIRENGYFVKWEKLAPPPDKITEIIPHGGYPIYIKISNGNTYRYENWHSQGWVEAVVPKESNPFEVIKPCNYSSPEFTFLSEYPHNINECIQVKVMYADGFIRYTFILDKDGNIWQWDLTRTPDSLFRLISLSCVGVLFGVIIGLISVNFIHQNKTRNL